VERSRRRLVPPSVVVFVVAAAAALVSLDAAAAPVVVVVAAAATAGVSRASWERRGDPNRGRYLLQCTVHGRSMTQARCTGVVFAFAGVKHAARVMAPQHHLHGEHRRRHAAPVQRVQGGGDPGGLAQLHPHTPLVMRILLFEKSLSYHQVQFPSLLLSCRTPIWLLIEHIIR
jgi:hypothetical protein